MKRHIFEAPALQTFTRNLFVAADTPRRIADDVAEILIKANLAGHDSHGVLRIPSYLDAIENGGSVQLLNQKSSEKPTTHFILIADAVLDIMQHGMRCVAPSRRQKAHVPASRPSRIPAISAESVNTHKQPLNRAALE